MQKFTSIKHLFLMLFLTAISTFLKPVQAQEMWGMTSKGGDSNVGVIFKSDTDGNIDVKHHFSEEKTGANPVYNSLMRASNGKLYGMTANGGEFDFGVIFEFNPVTKTYTKKYDFGNVFNDGGKPNGSMVELNGKLYGMAQYGGTGNKGVIFEFDLSTEVYSKLFEFTEATGRTPYGNLMVNDGKLYGGTSYGGDNNMGTLFEFDAVLNNLNKLFDFDGINGKRPNGQLCELNGKLYGSTYSGGNDDRGVIFEYDLVAGSFAKKHDFNTTIGYPNKDLTVCNNKLYGITIRGGTTNQGVIFEFDPLTNSFTSSYDLPNSTYGNLSNVNDILYGVTRQGGADVSGTLFSYNPVTSLYNTEHNFVRLNGASPSSTLLGFNGKLYGMTQTGGAGGSGVLFEYNYLTEEYIKRFDFTECLNGKTPKGSLTKVGDKLYGMTYSGGIGNNGIIFEFDMTTERLTKKHNFDYASGRNPRGSLVNINSMLYGMARQGGQNDYGTVFKYDPLSDSFELIHQFNPREGGLPSGDLVALNGKLYGMTPSGGASYDGVLFELDPLTKSYIVKHHFNEPDGEYPNGSLTVFENKLFGMTSLGGSNDKGILFEFDPETNSFSKKIDFDGTNGEMPNGSLTVVENKFYGLTQRGGSNSKGVLFEFDPAGNQLSVKKHLTSSTGYNPLGSLSLSAQTLYGMCTSGGYGTMFKYSVEDEIFTKISSFTKQNGWNPLNTALLVIEPELTAVCKDTTLALDTNGELLITPEDINGGSIGNELTMTVDPSYLACDNVGDNTITLTVKIPSGDSATCTSTVTVADTISPTALCQNIEVWLDTFGNVTLDSTAIDNGSSDACGIDSIALDISTFNCSNIGANTVTMTVTDVNGNFSTCTSTVTVLDTIAPTATCQDVTVHLDASGNAQLDASRNVQLDEGVYSVGPVAGTLANWMPPSGSSSTFADCDCPPDFIAVGYEGRAGGYIDQVSLLCQELNSDGTLGDVITSTCSSGSSTGGGPTGQFVIGPMIGGNIDCGSWSSQFLTRLIGYSQSVTYIASGSDNSSGFVTGNAIAAGFSGTPESPQFVPDGHVIVGMRAYSGISWELSVGMQFRYAPINLGSPSFTSSDACGIVDTVYSQTDFTCSNIGDNLVEMTVVDVNGNSSSCSSIVTIIDTIAPIVHCQPIEIILDELGVSTIDASDIDNGSTDVCGIASMELSKSIFDGTNIGANTVTLSVTDVNGNISTCTSTVTVKDTIAPVALCKNIGIALDEEGRTKVYSAFVDNGSTDEGGIVSYNLDVSRFNCADVGENTVVLSVRDVGGNVSTCTSTVTVNDSYLPEVACKDVEVSLNAEGIAVIDSSMIDNGSSAMCGISGIELSQSIFTGTHLDENIIIMTVANRSGVTASCEATVIVKDEIAPVANCNSIDVWLSDSSVYELSANDILMLAKGSSDNASPSDSLQIEVTPTTFNCSNLGDSVAVEVSITDQAGNESSCEAMVYVNDLTGVLLNSLTDIEISLAAGVCETSVDYPEVFSAKPCATFTQLEGLGADGLFPVGTTVETWEATNGAVADTVSFSIIVNSENAVPTLDSIGNVAVDEDATPVIVGLSGISGGNDCAVQDVTVTATNKNTALVTGINVSYTAVDSVWVLNIALAENESGTDSITIVVEDSEDAKTSRMFALEVAPVNDAPVLVTQLEDVELKANETVSISIPTILGTVFDDIDDVTLVYTLTMTDTKDAPTWLSVSEMDNELLIGLHPLQSDTGCYDVILEATDAAGATASDTFEVCIEELLTGINDFNNSEFEFTMYPNPSRGMVSLDVTTSFTGEAELYVMSITGQQVFHKTYLSNDRIKFDLSDQVSGSYLVILQVEGERTVKKLIIDKN